MQRLRTTFKRSRTPTGAEMKTQSSLEVPKQVRSASFDEIQLEAKRLSEGGGHSDTAASLLRVPQFPGQRSRSVDSGGSEESGNFLEVPPRRFQRRRSSSGKSPVCVHCVCVEEWAKVHPVEEGVGEGQEEGGPPMSSISDSSRLVPLEKKLFVPFMVLFYFSSECEEEPLPECSITVTLSPTIPSPPIQSPPPLPISPIIEFFPTDEVPSPSTPSRRKSIHRQEAFFAEPTGTSLENMSDGLSSEGALSEGDAGNTTIPGLIVRDIYLQVPDLKRDRAASVDSCFSKVSGGKTEELQHSGVSLEVPVGPNVALRSRSVDIVLPTDEHARYKALAMAATPSGSSSTYYKGG